MEFKTGDAVIYQGWNDALYGLVGVVVQEYANNAAGVLLTHDEGLKRITVEDAAFELRYRDYEPANLPDAVLKAAFDKKVELVDRVKDAIADSPDYDELLDLGRLLTNQALQVLKLGDELKKREAPKPPTLADMNAAPCVGTWGEYTLVYTRAVGSVGRTGTKRHILQVATITEDRRVDVKRGTYTVGDQFSVKAVCSGNGQHTGRVMPGKDLDSVTCERCREIAGL